MITAQPKHPQYSLETERLSSYTKWPVTSPQRPMVLSDAGLFYAGFSDCTRCFSCGIGLRNWEDGDIPWNEHARWCPNCDYLRKRKGDLFIQMHRQDHDQYEQLPQDPPSSECHFEDGKKEMEKPMASATCEDEDIAARSVIEMGYSESTVNSAVEQLRKQGKTDYYATDIMEIIFVKEETQRNTTQTPQNTSNTTESLESRTYAVSADSQSLLEENQNLKIQMICKICLDKDACMVYLPCGHMVTCQECAPTIHKCCICRKLIQSTVRAYM